MPGLAAGATLRAMADPIALQIIQAALTLRASHPHAPPAEVLDLAMQGHRGAHLDTEADGQVWADWLDPPSPFAALLGEVFAPDLDATADVWSATTATGRPLHDVWDERVWMPFAARYDLWRP